MHTLSLSLYIHIYMCTQHIHICKYLVIYVYSYVCIQIYILDWVPWEPLHQNNHASLQWHFDRMAIISTTWRENSQTHAHTVTHTQILHQRTIGQRPALKGTEKHDMTRTSGGWHSPQGHAKRATGSYTNTHTHAIKKDLAEFQLEKDKGSMR